MATNIANNNGNGNQQSKIASTDGNDNRGESEKDSSSKLHSIYSRRVLIHDFKLRDFYLASFVLVICIKFCIESQTFFISITFYR